MARGKARNKEEIIELLKDKLLLGMSVTKACRSIGIPQSTVQTWIDKDEDLRLKVGVWQRDTEDMARRVIKQKIQEGDEKTAGWYLERKAKDEFSTRQEVDEQSEQTLRIIYNNPNDEE